MNLLVISHSYMSEENQKNIVALSHHLKVRVAVPESFQSTVFKTVQARASGEAKELIKIFKTVHLPRSQFILKPLALDLFHEPTEVINIEYDPWSVMFWQAVAARRYTKCRSRIVCTVKNNTYTKYPGLLGKVKLAVAKRGIACVDLFLASSRMVARLYHEQFSVPNERIVVCHHLGVDTGLFCPAAKPNARTGGGKLVIGYCGRFDEDKGVLDLIEAVKDCRARQRLNLDLHLLGNGRLRDKILGLKVDHPWLQVFEPVPHAGVPQFLHGLDIFVLPARVSTAHEEHDAHALVEALAAGLPCIGTQSGIIPELISDGAGLLVPANASVKLADAIVKLAGDAALRESLGSAGRKKILDEHAIDALAKKKAGLFIRLGCN